MKFDTELLELIFLVVSHDRITIPAPLLYNTLYSNLDNTKFNLEKSLAVAIANCGFLKYFYLQNKYLICFVFWIQSK
jgi:hypothetical protein